MCSVMQPKSNHRKIFIKYNNKKTVNLKFEDTCPEWSLHLNSKLEVKMLSVEGVEKTSHITRNNKSRR